MANISPSHVQQCLNLAMHFLLRHLAAKMLSPLHNNFISFPYFFPSYETCSINVNHLFYAAIKNLHIKANGIFFFILLYFTTLSERITHTHIHARAQETISPLKMATNIPIAKESTLMDKNVLSSDFVLIHLLFSFNRMYFVVLSLGKFNYSPKLPIRFGFDRVFFRTISSILSSSWFHESPCIFLLSWAIISHTIFLGTLTFPHEFRQALLIHHLKVD